MNCYMYRVDHYCEAKMCVYVHIVFYMLTGYQCEHHNNPADFFLDVILENEQADDSQSTKFYKVIVI